MKLTGVAIGLALVYLLIPFLPSELSQQTEVHDWAYLTLMGFGIGIGATIRFRTAKGWQKPLIIGLILLLFREFFLPQESQILVWIPLVAGLVFVARGLIVLKSPPKF